MSDAGTIGAIQLSFPLWFRCHACGR